MCKFQAQGKIDKTIEINYYLIKSIYILFLALLLCRKKAKGK